MPPSLQGFHAVVLCEGGECLHLNHQQVQTLYKADKARGVTWGHLPPSIVTYTEKRYMQINIKYF
jgi:hypothetical protein